MPRSLSLLFLCTALILSLQAAAQVAFPALSPESFVKEHAGFTTFTLRYQRPAARGRKVMGALVPYGKLWRTGAGHTTQLTFNEPVVIAEKEVKAGTYSLLTIPNQHSWTIILNTDTTLFTTRAEYDAQKDVARFEAPPRTTPVFYESLLIGIDIQQNDARVFLTWENTEVSFVARTRTNERTIANIGRQLLDNASTNSDTYSEAVEYYYMNNLNLPEALVLIDKALAIKKDRWYFRQKAEVLEKMQRYPEAMKAAQAGITFLRETKPEEWQVSVAYLEGKINEWKRLTP